jgi:hypothetical protein
MGVVHDQPTETPMHPLRPGERVQSLRQPSIDSVHSGGSEHWFIVITCCALELLDVEGGAARSELVQWIVHVDR